MAWYPDMGHETMIAFGDHVRAVGWLSSEYTFARGDAPAEFVAKLNGLVRSVIHCVEALDWGIFMAVRCCELCQQAHGVANLGVPSGEVLFVSPEMVAHYVERHAYLPPAEFIAAVMMCPLPGTPEYRAAAEPFRRIHSRQIARDFDSA